MLRRSIITLGLLALVGCSTLPVSGPTGHEIERASTRAGVSPSSLPFTLVEVTTGAQLPAPVALPQPTLAPPARQPTDLIGPGDVLNITIYEVGVSLFGSTTSRLGTPAGGSAAASLANTTELGSNTARLPGVRVDDQGFIRLPFVGRLHAAGHTTAELQSMIRNGLRGMSQDPQVMVALDQSITNSIVLAGEVNKPGRLVLPTNRETLSDSIALAGGYKGEARDIVARVERGGTAFEIRLGDLMDSPMRDVAVAPGDRITLISRPQSFSVLGAPTRAEEIRFPTRFVSLAQAVALAGGANPNQGDAAAVFVFRYVTTTAGIEEPVVYHFNMMQPGPMFLSQRFAMRDKDLLYIGNAQANQPSKLVQLISQLFVPIATARTVAQ
jgi:polysaccharide export outer membrane protein